MRGRYYYFCSGGSIFTVSTVGRRGWRRMGKYMKKAKCVKNMEVSQSSLLGVRTRARALALEKRTSESILKHSFTTSPTSSKSLKALRSHKVPAETEEHHMQLRSRRLEKVVRHYEMEKKPSGGIHNGNELISAGDRSVDQASASVLPCNSRPAHIELRLINENLLDMPARNSCSSRPDFVLVGVSSARSPCNEDSSDSRVVSPAQSSLDTSKAAPLAFSTPRQTILGRGTTQMVTRHQQQGFDSMMSVDRTKVLEMGIERETSEATSPSANLQRKIEVGPCFGESPMIAGPSGKERHQGPNTRSQKRECISDNPMRKVEGQSSTFRKRESSRVQSSSAPIKSNEAPFSAEIEAFFATTELKERKRFIDRFNFDPFTEKPLKGRYLWLKE